MSFAAVYACGDAIEIPDVTPPAEVPDDGPSVTPGLSGDVVFTATAENAADGTPSLWKQGETIALYDGTAFRTLANEAADGSTGRFPTTLSGNEKGFLAVRPALEGISVQENTFSLTVPSVQTSGEAGFLQVAKGTGSLLYFRNLLATLSFTIGYEGVTRVRVETTGGEKITGAATVDYSGEDPLAAGSESYVELTGTFVKGETYTVAVLPGAIGGYEITGYSGDEATAHYSGAAAVLTPGADLSAGIIGEDIPTYRITNLWVWGGTGPEYGGTKFIDILTKPNYFNNEDGRGVTAWSDNYLELRPDGTFMNWAGEDGRNWWFVYSASVNPATRKDLDLKGFYDLIPRGQGSWTMSGQDITFTRPDGSKSSGTFVPAGTHAMSDGKSVTIAEGHVALRFTIQGGKDDWSHNYTDYDVIAAHPRILFIEVEPMPSGFSTPAASRTTDTEFAYTEPAAPSFDWTTLPGTWKVKALSVLGGSGDDPAWLSPVDKYWNWDDTIYKESDNTLTIAATSLTASEIKGTINWAAGADGAFWNYTWKKTGEDLSRFYDKLPKGQSAFAFDMSALKLTLSNGETPAILPPGAHPFAYQKALTVPDGCFALVFHLMDPISATADRWTDVDRFVNAPLEYAIIFEKP